MPGFPWGLVDHVTMTKSHGLPVYIDIGSRPSATCPVGGCRPKWPPYSMHGLPWGLIAEEMPLKRYYNRL